MFRNGCQSFAHVNARRYQLPTVICRAVLVVRLFFDVCDGIFLNYFWKESSLEQSKQLSTDLGRRHDVYVGVDVFVRGSHGNGGFNTVEVN